MEQQSVVITDKDAWSAAAAASALEPTTETVHETISVKLTDVMKAEIADEAATKDAEKKKLELELESIKASAKGVKAKISSLDDEMREMLEAVAAGVREVSGEWHVTHHFSTNTDVFMHPETGQVMCERAMSTATRQGTLDFDLSSRVLDEDDDEAECADSDAADDALADELNDMPEITDPETVLNGGKKKRGKKS